MEMRDARMYRAKHASAQTKQFRFGRLVLAQIKVYLASVGHQTKSVQGTPVLPVVRIDDSYAQKTGLPAVTNHARWI